jgi:Fungal cellulose binding domain
MLVFCTGGIGWTRAMTCAEGTCKVLSDYYSQISNQGFLAFFMGTRAN